MSRYNAFSALEKEMSSSIREYVFKSAMDDALEEFKKRIKPLIQEKVNACVMEFAKSDFSARDLAHEYRVYMSWKGEEENSIVEVVKYGDS